MHWKIFHIQIKMFEHTYLQRISLLNDSKSLTVLIEVGQSSSNNLFLNQFYTNISQNGTLETLDRKPSALNLQKFISITRTSFLVVGQTNFRNRIPFAYFRKWREWKYFLSFSDIYLSNCPRLLQSTEY